MPSYYVQAPAAPNNPPLLVVEVVAPEPAEVVGQFGNAQWIRVFKVELQRAVGLDELVADNPAVIPLDVLANLEANYSIIQDEPPAGGNGNRRRKRNQGNIAPTTRSVVRRIETWQFTGQYDPLNHLTFLENRNSGGVMSSYRYTLAATGRRDAVVEDTGRRVNYGYVTSPPDLPTAAFS